MMNQHADIQQKMIFATVETLMPEKHFLRNIESLIDFSFVYEIVAPLYSKTGRRSIDPIIVVKMLLLGYLYGIASERKLEKEIEVNIAYRWFLGIELDEKVPDHSTLSQLRRRKFKGSNLFEEIFTKIVHKCIEEGFVDGKMLLTDSTHVRANVRNDNAEYITVEVTPSEYLQRINKEAEESGLCDTQKNLSQVKPKKKVIRKNPFDPDAGFMKRTGKPLGFYYLDHQTCDSKHGIITDVFVTAGNTQDSSVHSKRICHQIDKFNLNTESICADAAYDSGEIHKDMLKRNIQTYIPKRQTRSVVVAEFDSDMFEYDEEKDVLICPNKQMLRLSCFIPKSGCKRYVALKSQCIKCTLRSKCISSKMEHKEIERGFHKTESDIQHRADGTVEYLSAMRLRKIFCEGNFSHQKARHNLARMNKLGIGNATVHCLLSACAFNLKRMVKLHFS